MGLRHREGLIRGSELEKRLRLGAEMLLDRACPGGGWNAVVYGVPLRPHIDATPIALAGLQIHYHLPIVLNSLTWMLNRIDCPSAYSVAWVTLAAAAYKDVRSDVSSALDRTRGRLAALVDDPRAIQDTSTIALAALALGPPRTNGPAVVKFTFPSDPKIPLEDGGIQTPSATRIVKGFRARFDKACDASVWKRLSSAVSEPANRFDVKARRQLRQEAHHSRDARSHGARVGSLLQSQRDCEVTAHGEE